MTVHVSTTEAQWPFDPDDYQLREEKGQADGYASLDEDGLVPAEQLPPGGSGVEPIPLTDKGAADGVATLDGTGQVPSSQLGHVVGGAAQDTKRVSLPIGSDGVNSATASSNDFNQRTLIQLPVTTTQWRLRWRNASPLSGSINASAWSCSGVWVGTPSFGTAGNPWGRVFTATPTQALGSFATPADGSDYVSAWVTDPAQQFQQGVPTGLSTGLTHAASTAYAYSTQGWTYSGAGAAAAAGNASPLAVTPTNMVVGDWRLEYEFDTPSGVAGVPVGLMIGDSITASWSSETSNPSGTPPVMQGFDPAQTWPGAAALRNGFAWVNLGVGSTRAAQWATGTGWRWDRCDLATTIPDFAIIMLGTNDVFDGTAQATIQQYIQSVIGVLNGLGIHEIWLGTQIPRNFSGASETVRTGLNRWIRNGPSGIAGVFDFDKALYLQASPAVMDSDYVTLYPHPNRAGYQAMASVVQRTR